MIAAWGGSWRQSEGPGGGCCSDMLYGGSPTEMGRVLIGVGGSPRKVEPEKPDRPRGTARHPQLVANDRQIPFDRVQSVDHFLGCFAGATPEHLQVVPRRIVVGRDEVVAVFVPIEREQLSGIIHPDRLKILRRHFPALLERAQVDLQDAGIEDVDDSELGLSDLLGADPATEMDETCTNVVSVISNPCTSGAP